MDLSERQVAIIKAIVEEFTNTGEPVGSHTLDNRYRLGVSSATIRNEMSELVEKGYLLKPHASAGRIPTAQAIRFYVQELLKERDLSVAEEVSLKERVWDYRNDQEALLREATRVLAERTKSLSVAAIDSGYVYHSGYANLLNTSEFYNLGLFKNVLLLLDEQQRILEMFNRAMGQDTVHLLVGDELGVRELEPVSIVFADIQVGDQRGSLGIIGPNRQHYAQNIPFVRYVATLINQFAQSV
jgi:heat-inducible transcriptional repressor